MHPRIANAGEEMHMKAGSPSHKQYLIGLIHTCARELKVPILRLNRERFRIWAKGKNHTLTSAWAIRIQGGWGKIQEEAQWTLINRSRDESDDPALDELPDWDNEDTDEYPILTLITEDAQFAELFEAIRKNGLSIRELCDKLDLSPKKLDALIRRALDAGASLVIENDHIGSKHNHRQERPNRVHEIPAQVGEEAEVAVISDIHFGSKYCLTAQLEDFINFAYDRGIRTILCPGDVLDGVYRHSRFEQAHVGLDAQIKAAFDGLPERPGLHYYFITGNHDETFTGQVGVSTGYAMQTFFAEHGRKDVTYLGERGEYVHVHGALIHLWHPSGGRAYARSYSAQKKIESYAPGEKPHILLTGHYHFYAHCHERGVHGVNCPTFSGGGSSFGRSLKDSAQSIGGLILKWTMGEDGNVKSFGIEQRFYYEKPLVHRIERPQGKEAPNPPTREPWIR
jgi:UDP-2,3-diacylglucosamine pyrophosphatase LpxH